MARRPKDPTNDELTDELAAILTTDGWAYGLYEIARCVRSVKLRLLGGDASLAPAFREQKLLIECLYNTAGLDVPDTVAALFE